MKISVLDAKSDEWQDKCPVVDKDTTADRGGVIVIIEAQNDSEAFILGQFSYANKRKMPKKIVCENFYTEFDGSRNYLLIYQIWHKTSDDEFDFCFQVAGDLVEKIGELIRGGLSF